MTREDMEKRHDKISLMNEILDEEEELFKKLNTYLEQINN